MQMTQSPLSYCPSIHPYMGVTRDEKRGDFRIIIYAAYNAMGLIGSEGNGIAIFDDLQRRVLADELGCETSGYFGPSARQIQIFERLLACTPKEFCDYVNKSGRNRWIVKPADVSKAPKKK